MSAILSMRLPQFGGLRAVLDLQVAPFRTSRTQLLLSYRGIRQPKLPLLVATRQARRISVSSLHRAPNRPNEQETQPPRPSFTKFVWLTLRSSLSSVGGIMRGKTLKALFHESPEETVLAVGILVCLSFIMVYIVYLYFTYFYAEYFTRYPKPVAKSLRRALYYSNNNPDHNLALKYYKMAIEQCNEHGLDPFSDKVMGIKIQLAAWLEKIEHHDLSIQVLEMLSKENKKWVDIAESTPEKLPFAPRLGSLQESGDAKKEVTKQDFDSWVRASRTRILLKTIQINVKLGELYSDEHVLQLENAHERLTWGVETALREFRRRQEQGVKDGEGTWMSPEEVGGALESLAHSYERKYQFDLALPLFFQALRLCRDQCHMAVLMNNLAVSYAQHPPHAPYETLAGVVPGEEGKVSTTTSEPLPETRKELLESATRWAKNALQHAKEPKGDARTPECDEACAVALINLGKVSAMSGDVAQARRRFERSIAMSEKVGFAPGVSEAQSELRRLSK